VTPATVTSCLQEDQRLAWQHCRRLVGSSSDRPVGRSTRRRDGPTVHGTTAENGDSATIRPGPANERERHMVRSGAEDGPAEAVARSGTSRRTVLGGAGAVGAEALAAATLAACGDVGIQPVAAPTRTGPVALGPTSDVPVGGGKVYADQVVVVTQPSPGSFKCFSATCTHAGCLLHDVTGGTINCTCHGSQFSIVDGSVTRPPAERPLPAEQITVTGGEITLD
jgi:Rieske Fe-S protein